MQEALEATLIANGQVSIINLTTDILFHLNMVAALRNSGISCLSHWSCITFQGICRDGRSRREVEAIHSFARTLIRMAKPRARLLRNTCNLCLQLGECVLVVGAIVPMNEAVEIGQITDSEVLTCNRSVYEQGHLVMTAQRSDLLIASFIQRSFSARYKSVLSLLNLKEGTALNWALCISDSASFIFTLSLYLV
jgi:hypothetical protein